MITEQQKLRLQALFDDVLEAMKRKTLAEEDLKRAQAELRAFLRSLESDGQ